MASDAAQFILAGTQKLSATARQQNQRALARRGGIAPDVTTLHNTHKPWVSTYVILGVMAALLDCIGFFQVAIDATVIGFIILTAANLIFFLCVRGVLNRSPATLFFLTFCLGAALLFNIILLVPFALVFLAPVIIAGIFNPREAVIIRSKESVMAHVGELEASIAASRRRYAALLRLGRSIKATRTVASKAYIVTKRVTQASKVLIKWGSIEGGKIIPIIGMLPLNLWGLWSTYHDQKKHYQEAQDLLAAYEEAELAKTRIDREVTQAEVQRLVVVARALQDREEAALTGQFLEPVQMPAAT